MGRTSFQLRAEKFGIETALNTLQRVSEDLLQFNREISYYKAELLRKQGIFVAAAENYTKFVNATCNQNEDKYQEHKICAHLNLVIAKYKSGLVDECLSLCHNLLNESPPYVQVSLYLLMARCLRLMTTRIFFILFFKRSK